MTPIKGCSYSAIVLVSGWPKQVQTFVYYNGKNYIQEGTGAVVYPLSIEPRTSADVAKHDFKERWNAALRAGG